MSFVIERAERRKVKIRIGLSGPAGCGKTYSALLVAAGLCNGDYGKVCIINTEGDRAHLYSHLGDYAVIKLCGPYTPERYIEAIAAAEKAGYDCIIVDSLSHEWSSAGGIMDAVDKMRESNPKKNAWLEMTPRHRKLVDKIVTASAHIICTFRVKTDYNYEGGKPVKTGLKDDQRDGWDYEMTVYGRLGINHLLDIEKDNTGLFAKENGLFMPGVETGAAILAWCQEGKDVPAYVKELTALANDPRMPEAGRNKLLGEIPSLTAETASEKIAAVKAYLATPTPVS